MRVICYLFIQAVAYKEAHKDLGAVVCSDGAEAAVVRDEPEVQYDIDHCRP